MIKLSEEKVLILHELLTEETGGSAGVRDMGLLNSALESAYATFGGDELYPSREEKGARVGFSLISNHAFVDGNKRIGMFIMLIFLEVNGVKIRPTNDEVVRVGLAVAAGEMKYEELLAWIRESQLVARQFRVLVVSCSTKPLQKCRNPLKTLDFSHFTHSEKIGQILGLTT